MNLMAKWLIFTLLVVTVLPRTAAADTNTDGNEILDRLSIKIQAGEIFEADMTHEFIDSFTQDTVYTRGKIWVGENKYKVSTLNQEITVDGETSIVFNRDQNKVIISNYYPEDDDFAPSRFLGGFSSAFSVSDCKTGDDGLVTIVLEAVDVFEIITRAELKIYEPALLPVEINAVDQSENIYNTQFTSGKFLTADDAYFEVFWPEDAEVVDLREE